VLLGPSLDRFAPPWYQRLFNAALFAFVGLVSSALFYVLAGAPSASRVMEQLPPAVVALLADFVLSHALVVTVIAIDTGRTVRAVWNEKFSWFLPHYLAQGLSAYAMAMGYLALGLAGAAVFFVPVGMLWFGVKQYTARTRRDAEELQHANLALARNEERFRSLVQNAPGLIAVLNPDGSLQYLNPTEVLTSAAANGRGGTGFAALVHPDDRGRFQEAMDDTAAGRRGGRSLELKISAPGGGWRDYEVALANLVDNVSVRGIVINARDVTERKQLEGQLRHEAFHDPLTQLPNRALFMDRLRRALRDAADGRYRVAVLFLDLDRFKVVNDSLGHNVGDELLVALAGRLIETAGDDATVARFGGDEFVLMIPRLTSDSEATELARRILDALRHPVKLLGHNTSVSASIGISISTAERNQPPELLRSADVALFHAKELGRGRSVLFDETLDRYSVERLELESELREAVDGDQLVLEYQPEVHLGSGRIIGAEALVRWDHPERGRIPPGDFISLAEETGEIVKIGKWVLGTACAQAAEWKANLPAGMPFTMAINLSANEFMEAGLPWEVLRTLRETGLDPRSLRIEITESVLLHDAPFINEVFLDLKQLGVELAIDDFGTGYSSLSYLRKLPADVLKVDRSFVSDIDRDQREAAVVQAVIAVADALGMRVTTEGIERFEQLEYLSAIGCEFGQGFLFARPLPAPEFAEMLEQTVDRERSAS
jgi:diguanylate cyclase (GGDEF)-like protein/PAS domain S-box-containing protein